MTPEAPRQHYYVTLAVLSLAAAAYSLLQMMVVPALPVIARDLHTTATWTSWLLTVFLLVGAVAAPILGKLGDQYGKDKLIKIVIAVYLIGAIGATFAWNIWALIGFRALSGAGAGFLPLAAAVIRDEFPRERVGFGIGMVTGVYGFGTGLGLVIAGPIVDNLSWRWLFALGALLSAVSLTFVVRFIPRSQNRTRSRVDVPGAILLSGGLLALMLALSEGNAWGWTSPRTLALFAVSALLLVVWGIVESRVRCPMIDMRMLSRKPVLLTNATALLSGVALFGVIILVPNFVEEPRGLPPQVARLVHYGFDASATRAGLYILPLSVAMLVAGTTVGRLGSWIGFKWPAAAGLTLLAVSAAALVVFHDRPWEVAFSMLSLGFGIGLGLSSILTLISENVAPEQIGVANGMATVMRAVGGVVGGQLGAALLAAHTIGGTTVPSVRGYELTFAFVGAVGLCGAVIACFIPQRQRHDASVWPVVAEPA